MDGVRLETWEVDRELALVISSGSFHQKVADDRMHALECEAVQRLVNKELKWRWAEQTGLEVDPSAAQASWQEVRDRFADDEQYRAALELKGIPEAGFRRIFQRDAAAEAVDAAIVAGVGEPSETEVEVYFILHRDRYMTPEARHVVHALVYVPPTAGREEWRRAERQARALARDVAGGNVTLLEAADSLRDQVPPRFQDLVGDIGFVHRGSLTPAVDQAVFAAEPGSVTEPVLTIYGYHVLQIVGTEPPRPLELDEVRDAVAASFATEQQQRRLQSFERGLREKSVVKVTGCDGTP